MTTDLGSRENEVVKPQKALEDAVAALRESEERYALALKASNDGIWDWNITTGEVFFSDRWKAILGYQPDEISDKVEEWKTRIHPEDFDRVMAAHQENFEGKIPHFEVEYRLLHKDGSYCWILGRGACLRDDRGVAIRAAGSHTDITERKRAEIVLRESESRSRAIIDASPVPLALNDEHGNITFLNKAFTQVIGYTANDISTLADWWPRAYPDPQYRQWVEDNWQKNLEEAKRTRSPFVPMEFNIRCKDDSVRTFMVGAATLEEDFSGNYLVILYDITDRKRAEEEKRILEEQVRHTQKLESLGVLAGGIAHDFNNLLMAVLGHAELALEEISPMSTARGDLTEITTAARRAADLCQQMLAYAGKSSVALERVGLRDLVEEMAHLLKTAISKKAILNLHMERGLPPIQADPSQIRQIVMNLIINASEAIGDQSGVITVSVGATRCDEEYLRKTELREALAPGLYVYLEVTDTGSGMDAQTRSRIFEPFFSTKFTGRGLGLAAVLGIVRAHKGALKVYSEPGKGTTFKVLFPALENGENGARTDETSPLAGWRGTGTILLVDDEKSLIALGTRMLEHLGFTVLTAADGLQAVDLYREKGKEIDLVLMDLTMPHMDGSEAFSELRRLNPGVRVVLASGYGHEDVASRFAGKGLDGVLQKPYTLLKLRESLAGLMPKRPDGEE